MTRKEFNKKYEELTVRRIEVLSKALDYVADMTYCGSNGEWHFKPGYDPQIVLHAINPTKYEHP